MKNWRDAVLTFVDVEGNGASPPEIVEIGIVACGGNTNEYSGNWLVRPKTPITPIVQRIHGISNSDVSTAPNWSIVLREIEARLNGAIVVAHSANTERAVLARQIPGWRPEAILDTRRLAKAAWPNLASYSLTSLKSHLGIETRSHRALSDAKSARDVFIRALSSIEASSCPVDLDRVKELCGIDLPPDPQTKLNFAGYFSRREEIW